VVSAEGNREQMSPERAGSRTHFVGIFLVNIVFELLTAELDEVFRVNLDHVCYGRLAGYVSEPPAQSLEGHVLE